MPEDIERLIQRHLRTRALNRESRPAAECPAEVELCDYLEGRLGPQRQQQLSTHLAACADCLSLLELAKGARRHSQERPSPAMIARAKRIMRQRAEKRWPGYRWLLLAAPAFACSFIFARYFIQFLTLAVILSIKWIFDTGSTRTLIMIYQAWRRQDQGTACRIIQDLQDKSRQRR